jgi:hypothetical protein
LGDLSLNPTPKEARHFSNGKINASHASYIPNATKNIRLTVPPISPVAMRTFVKISKRRFMVFTPLFETSVLGQKSILLEVQWVN